MKKYLDNIFILAIILIVSIIVAFIFSFKFDRNLYVGKNEIAPTVEVKEVTKNDEVIDKIEIKYDWQIAIPKINLVAPIEESIAVIQVPMFCPMIIGSAVPYWTAPVTQSA